MKHIRYHIFINDNVSRVCNHAGNIPWLPDGENVTTRYKLGISSYQQPDFIRLSTTMGFHDKTSVVRSGDKSFASVTAGRRVTRRTDLGFAIPLKNRDFSFSLRIF